MSDIAVNGKRPAPLKKPINAKKPNISENNVVKCASEVPMCLKKLVKQIVRTFYGCEHALLMNLLLRNTIMKEDDLIDRLKFDKKMLRQILHSLKTDQFIKSKMQLETEPVEGKSLFVNVVKYKLDVIQKRLEAEQRESSSRASFKCAQCRTAYTDLEIDRLIDPMIGKLVCTFCRGEVVEEEDSAQRSDACALVARFNQQVRIEIDPLLRECEAIHLSSSILEPEIRPLEPINDSKSDNPAYANSVYDEEKERKWASSNQNRTENQSVKIILDSCSDTVAKTTKERPVWLRESTVNNGGLGALDRGPSQSTNNDSVTQTLVPGRVPIAHTSSDGHSSGPNDGSNTSGAGSSGDGHSTNIMQLLLVHERRGLASHSRNTAQPSQTKSSTSAVSGSNSSSKATANTTNSNSNSHSNGQIPPSNSNGSVHYDANMYSPPAVVSNVNSSQSNDNRPDATSPSIDLDEVDNSSANFKKECSNIPSKYVVHLERGVVDYRDITPKMLKTMSAIEKDEYILVGKKLYKKYVFE